MIVWVIAACFAVIGAVFGGVAALGRWRIQSPAVDRFALTAAIAGAGSLALALAFAFRSPLLILVVTIMLGLSLPVPWALFAFDYTGIERLVSWRVAGLISIPVVVGLLSTSVVFGIRAFSWFDPWSLVGDEQIAAAGRTFLNMSQWFALLYAGGLMLSGSGLIVWVFQRYDHLDSTTGIVLGTFGTVSWLSTLFGIQFNSISTLSLGAFVAIGMGISAVAAVALVGPSPLFERVPAAGNVGPSTVIEELDDPVIVTDGEGRVIETNHAAEESLDVDAKDTLGADIDRLLGAPIPELRETPTIGLETLEGQILLDPTVSHLTDQYGHDLGYAVVLRDVTERTTRRQQLEVFNRVLRHNLGNNLTVIQGHTELIQSRTDNEEIVESTTQILANSHELVELAEKVRDVEEVLDIDVDTENRTRLALLAEEVLTQATETQPGATWQLDIPEGTVVEAPPEPLRLVLANLVENAIEHNDSDDPRLWVSAEDTGDNTPLRVSVADNGPGIPEQERRTIEAGNETQLQHSSGIGLWVVRWVVTKMGGRLEFAERDPCGTIVSFSLPVPKKPEVSPEAKAA